MRNSLFILLFIFLANSFFISVNAQELPRGSSENCFYIMPLFESIRVPGQFSNEEKLQQIIKMKNQLGEGNLYHRLGFSFIYLPYSDAEVRSVCKLAQENGIHLGVIFASQSHTRPDYRNVADEDFRNYQWRLDGEDWKGSFTTTGELEVPEDQRDYKIPTPSRYAKSLRKYNHAKVLEWAEAVKKLMDDYPGVITCLNGPIEEELTIGGYSDTDKLGDYSPFAITEFRDWLRHSGIYDASSGEYAGEGASSLIIGDLIDFNGTLRSQFYDDPTPNDNNGTGVSFNEFFGTIFTTWSLRYWDLKMYPDPITDEDFEVTPEWGEGNCKGGFDAPRTINIYDKLWKAWSYDIPDQLGKYPEGNPETPAYGFRQNLVRNFVRDLFDVLETTDLPRNIMYPHQIPGEALGNFTGAGGRVRSSASTIWTGYDEKSQTVGITRFGDVDPLLMTQYADDWGIFEWHTSPNTDPQDQHLYDVSIAALNNYYTNKCHYLFPGWWGVDAPTNSSIFPLNDSKFTEAIQDFMQSTDEVPYNLQGSSIDYLPPQLCGLDAWIDESNQLQVYWNETIWEGLLQKWNEWKQFSYFELEKSLDGENWETLGTSTSFNFTKNSVEEVCKIRVRAVSKKDLKGAWSEVVYAEKNSGIKMSMEPEFSSLYADPNMKNEIILTVDGLNQTIDADLLNISITGEGNLIQMQPANIDEIEKFWPMNSTADLNGVMNFEKIECKDGVFIATVGSTPPIDPYFNFMNSAIDGTALPYISFMLYSDVSSVGSVYWFINDGPRSKDFVLKEGWNLYEFNYLPDWVSQNAISQVRLDPGTTASAKIMLDWFAISSKPMIDNYKPEVLVDNNIATFQTAPTSIAGSYTVTAEMNGVSASATIETHAVNVKPVVSILSPQKDTLVELGVPFQLISEASDADGEVVSLNYFANNVLFSESTPEFETEWIPNQSGSFEVKAVATDNADQTAESEIISVQVIEQESYLGDPSQVPCKIESEDYDIGGNEISFCDQDETNQGAVYRTDAVDIYARTDGEEGYCVGQTTDNEWLEYTIELAHSMMVNVDLMISSITGGGEVHLEINNEQVCNRLMINKTGDTQTFQKLSFREIYLNEGIQKLKLYIDKGEMSIDFIEILDLALSNQRSIVEDNLVYIYPNPVRDKIYFNANSKHQTEVKIVSLDGQTLKIGRFSACDEYFINVSDLPEGLYLIRIVREDKIITKKFLKIK